MTREEELLFRDLCARLPYGVKVESVFINPDTKEHKSCGIETFNATDILMIRDGLGEFKPYLFPLSSMTEEQYEEWCGLEAEPLDEVLARNANGEKMSTLEHHLLIAKSLTDSVNYCYKNHFDIYGLIPMGLAIDATGLNIY